MNEFLGNFAIIFFSKLLKMKITLNQNQTPSFDSSFAFIASFQDFKNAKPAFLSENEYSYICSKLENEKTFFFSLQHLPHFAFINLFDAEQKEYQLLERIRVLGNDTQKSSNKLNIKSLNIFPAGTSSEQVFSFLEGLCLGNYQFLKYKSDKKNLNTLEELSVYSTQISEKSIEQLQILTEAVHFCRNLVNEPLSGLNALQLAEAVKTQSKDSGLQVTVLHKAEIEALKMGGLLGVNKGSIDPPTFTVMEWKPENAVNQKPVVFVGKGVVFDTGGINIKTDDHMDNMKDDMSGAATVAAAIWAVAKAKLPVHVVALLPATDNRPDGNAMVPGDVITMMDGTTVEVLNTDAEGRLILADGICYANQYNPEVIITAATLTGAAQRAIGKYGIVAMHQDAQEPMQKMRLVGEKNYEYIAEFPFWEEYGELIKSSIADIQNIGGANAGMITAGKFLQHFAKAPFIHLDIAGVSFTEADYDYRTQGGTGIGVRLLYRFIENLLNK